MKCIVYILALFLLLPELGLAQSKPKRDTSKDNSVIVEKHRRRAALLAARKKKQMSQSKGASRKQKNTPIEHDATYLTVNQLTTVSKVLDSNGGNVSFNIATDGKEWAIYNLPYWCRVSKHSDWFLISYDANPTHEVRQDWFDVKCDNQEVRIYISQQGAPMNIRAKINSAFLFHNERISSIGQYLKITANLTITGAAGQTCWLYAYIVNHLGLYVKARRGYENFALQNSNNIYVASKMYVSTDSPETFTITSYIPNNAMELLRKNNKLQCELIVYCNGHIYDTHLMRFKAKSKRGVVKTKHWR